MNINKTTIFVLFYTFIYLIGLYIVKCFQKIQIANVVVHDRIGHRLVKSIHSFIIQFQINFYLFYYNHVGNKCMIWFICMKWCFNKLFTNNVFHSHGLIWTTQSSWNVTRTCFQLQYLFLKGSFKQYNVIFSEII